jgi:hypothetical protein
LLEKSLAYLDRQEQFSAYELLMLIMLLTATIITGMCVLVLYVHVFTRTMLSTVSKLEIGL